MILLSDVYSIDPQILAELITDVLNWLSWKIWIESDGVYEVFPENNPQQKILLQILPISNKSQLKIDFSMENAQIANLLLDEVNAVLLDRK